MVSCLAVSSAIIGSFRIGCTPGGKSHADEGYACYPQFQVAGSGAGGATGQADAALGFFDRKDTPPTPQVLCEFKDVRSNLDGPQKRMGNTRSPVKQRADSSEALR